MILHITLTLAACWLLWVFYVCVMRLKMLRDAGTLTAGQKVLGYPRCWSACCSTWRSTSSLPPSCLSSYHASGR